MAGRKNIKSKKVKAARSRSVESSINYIDTGFWRKSLIGALIIFIVSLALYISSVNFEYVLDDKIVFTENNFVKEGFGGTWNILSNESFVGYFGEQKELVAGGRYRPLSIVSFAWEFGMFGQKKGVSHLINALLYALGCLLLFRVLSLMFYSNTKNRNWYISLSFIAAILFAVHPIHVEVVANVKGRDEIMALIGSLSSIYFAYRYLSYKNILPLFLSGLCFFLGAMSKENTLMFAIILPMTLWFFSKASFKRIMIASLPIAIAAIIYITIRTSVVGFGLGKEVTDLMNNPFAGMSASDRFATIFYTLGVYLKLLVFPHPLTHDYYPYHIPKSSWSDFVPLLSLSIHVGLAILAILGLKKKKVFSYCIIFYLATLVITSNLLFPIGTFMNERFIYMSSVGFCIFIAWILSEKLFVGFKENGKTISLVVLALLFLGLSIKTLTRVPDWKNRMTLNRSAIKVSKNSARANLFMATSIFELLYLKSDDEVEKKKYLAEADALISKALEIHPNYGSALIMEAGVLTEEYRFDKDLDKLLKEFERLLKKKNNLEHIDKYLNYLNGRSNGEMDSKLINFYYNIGTYFADKRGNFGIARKYFKMGLQLSPSNPQLNQALQRVKK